MKNNLEVGKIINTHGVKGEVVFDNNSDFIENRLNNNSLFYVENDKKIPLELVSYRKHKNKFLITFKGFSNIDESNILKGKTIFTESDESDVNMLKNDEFFYNQLIGSKVIDENEKIVGIVESLLELPNQTILEIKNNKNEIDLIPFVKAYVIEVDTANKIIKIEFPKEEI